MTMTEVWTKLVYLQVEHRSIFMLKRFNNLKWGNQFEWPKVVIKATRLIAEYSQKNSTCAEGLKNIIRKKGFPGRNVFSKPMQVWRTFYFLTRHSSKSKSNKAVLPLARDCHQLLVERLKPFMEIFPFCGRHKSEKRLSMSDNRV